MKTMITLIKRELWEHRASFFNIPLLVGTLFSLIGLCSLILMMLNVHFSMSLYHVFNSDNLSDFVHLCFYVTGIPFVVVLWLIVGNYFLSCLYDDRKDRSILFWHSMPISHTQEITAKLITGIIIAPLYTFFAMLLTQLVLLSLAMLTLLYLGAGFWLALWHPIPIFMIWFTQVITLIVQMFWLLPIFTWFMLCSAYAKKAPFLRALVPVVVALVLELFFLPHQWLWSFITTHIFMGINLWQIGASDIMLPFHHAALSGYNTMFFGLIVSFIFIVLATYVRNRRNI